MTYNPFVDNLDHEPTLDRLAQRPRGEVGLMGVLYTAAHELANADSEHAVPSPSGVADCRLKQWFTGREVPRSNPIPPANYKKMETGRHIERFWHDIYEQAGFDVLPTPDSEPFDNFKGGQGDGILVIRTDELAETMGLRVGDRGLLELKDLGMWTFDDYVLHGTEGKDIEHYKIQTQIYLGRYNLKFAVLHGGIADNSAQMFLWQRMRKREGNPPPFWLEIVYPDPVVYAAMNARAGEVNWYIENVEQPPLVLKDFDPEQGKFPCGSDERPYCGWRDLCKKVRNE